MLARCRFALMCLMLIALPLQGFAAATMLHCGSGSAAAAPSHHEVSAGEHQHHVDAAMTHHDAVPDVEDARVSVEHLHKLAKAKCSACAACCMGVAPPMAALLFTSSPVAVAPNCFVPVARVGFFTDVPERPPRFFLA